VLEDLSSNWTTNIALRAHELIQDRTPIDTGRAIGSWNVSIGDINPRTLPEDFNRARDPGAALSAASRAQIDAVRTIPGDPFFISNSVPYIRFLEAGSSRQAPAGMVQVALGQLRLELRSLDPRRRVRIG